MHLHCADGSIYRNQKGFIDGELAYATANTIVFSKELLFRGDAAYLSNTDPFKTFCRVV